MRTTILIVLVKITFIFAAFCATSSSQAQQDKFNYSTSVGFVLYVDNGGHIFQRPDNAEQRTSFNVAYEIVAKYSSQMQRQHAGLALDISSLPIEEKFLLINHNGQKLIFLGDHWIGDGERFSIMEGGDYHRLQQLFAKTRKHRGKPTEKAVLEAYIKDIHKLWADDPEEFYREFYFPEPKSTSNTVSSPTDITYTKTALDMEIEKTNSRIETETDTDTDTQARERELKEAQHAQEKQKGAVIEETAKSFAGNQLPDSSMRKQVPINTGHPEKTTETYRKLWLFLLLLILLSLAVYWRRKPTK